MIQLIEVRVSRAPYRAWHRWCGWLRYRAVLDNGRDFTAHLDSAFAWSERAARRKALALAAEYRVTRGVTYGATIHQVDS